MTELLSYARVFRETVLRGSSSERMCAALSAPLAAALEVRGVPCQLVVSSLRHCDHIFLLLAEGQVLDPTADQFNWALHPQLPGVYLGPPALIHQRAVPWPGGQEWRELMLELRRLHPEMGAAEVGRTVSFVLRTLPPGLCEFAPNCMGAAS